MPPELWAEDFPYEGPTGVPLGLIRGSGTWGIRFPEDAAEPGVTVLWEGRIPTPYPRGASTEQRQSPRFQLLQLGTPDDPANGGGRQAIAIASHGWQPGEDPVDESAASQKVFWLLSRAGVKWVIGGGTCGSLNNAILPGDLVIHHDFIDLTKARIVGLPGTHLNFARFTVLMRMAQGICPTIARVMEEEARQLPFPRVYGYGQHLLHFTTEGPWFETPAEVRDLRLRGGDTVGQSLAPEAHLARLCGMHIAFAHYSVNPAEGLTNPNWQLDLTHEQQAVAMAQMKLRALKRIPIDGDCDCLSYRVVRPAAHYASGVEG
ncbi:MAG: phosphorylase family protein [Chloroflexota bacterium]